MRGIKERNLSSVNLVTYNGIGALHNVSVAPVSVGMRGSVSHSFISTDEDRAWKSWTDSICVCV